MEKKSLSLLVLSNTISRFPSDLKKNTDFIYQLMDECLLLIQRGRKESAGIAYVMNPLVVDWLSTEEAKVQIERLFMVSMQENRIKKQENIEELYTIWMKINCDIPSALNKLQEDKKMTVIPSLLVNFPVTHLITGWAIEMLLTQSLYLYNKHFEKQARGIWLPHCAYSPGIDLFLKEQGLDYTFVSHTTYEYSEKDDRRSAVLRTPRGLSLIPVDIRTKDFHMHTVDGLSSRADELIEELIDKGYSIEPFIEQTMLNQQDSLTRAGFGYLGMDEGKAILSDGVLVLMRELHTLEQKIKEWKTPQKSQPRVYKQLIREWMACLHYLITYEELDSTCLQAFMELSQQKQISENIHLLEYREGLEYLPLQIGESRPSEEKVLSPNRQPTVLMLSWEYPPNIVGGLSRHVHDLSKSLVKKGCRVIVVTASAESAPEFEEDEGVQVYRTGPLHPIEEDFLHWVMQLNLSFIEKTAEIFVKENIDLVHAHDWIVGKAAEMVKRHYHIPLLTTIHATESGRNQGIFTELQKRIHEEEKNLVALSDQVIICSDHMKEELLQLEPKDQLPISVIPNGVYLNSVFQDDRYPLNEALLGKNYYFSIGRTVHEKGFETIIETSLLISKEKNIHFVIAGKGPLLEEYRRRVKEKGLDDFVHFVGYVSDAERNTLLFHSEAVIFPSIYEPFGIVALEAMAARKAVIASKTGGLKSLVEHGNAGLLFDPGNAESLKSCILELNQSNSLKTKMGDNGYKMAEMMFSWERISKQTMEIYEELTLQHRVEGSLL
ncbi:glycosyltransferase [Bacillus salacetis]|uniref:Glycosyltransferase n=1 Tax=Bacillus salacetis TaxID=2315464 RepID=A0A3A1QTK5_9BACI|nr:glycosyltransferase family 4 protein [Bacillus salacetis]RIW31052.1 glycosyltransferase [Bacillus salacetis]